MDGIMQWRGEGCQQVGAYSGNKKPPGVGG
jgi:hypothetical protein